MAQPLFPKEGGDGEGLTWAMLLGRWVDFARSSVALPDTPAGRAMQGSIADVVMLQAVWFALGDMGALPADQRALGLDRAGVLIDRHAEALAHRWAEVGMPGMMMELIDEARDQLAVASSPPEGSPPPEDSDGGESPGGEGDRS